MIFDPESGGVYICNKSYNIGGPFGFEENKCYIIGFVENNDGTKDMWSDGVWYVSIREYKIADSAPIRYWRQITGSVLVRYWWEILPQLVIEGHSSKLSE
jgi:hypothetical protein